MWGFILKNWLPLYDLKYCPSLANTFFPSFWQFSDTISKKRCVFWDDPWIDLFFDFFIRAEMLMSQAICHQSKQMVVGRSNIWRVRRVGYDLTFQRFQVCLDQSCDMWPNIVMLEDNFVVSLLILWPFLLQCSAQTYQLRSIPIPYDDFTRFQQLIIHRVELVLLNAEHNLGTVNIRSGRQREGMSGYSPRFSALGIIVVDPFFVAG